MFSGVLLSIEQVSAGIDGEVFSTNPSRLMYYIVGGIVLLSVLAIFRKLTTKSVHNLPPVLPSMIPVLGSFLEFAKDPLGMVRNGYEKLGPCFTATMFGQQLTFLVGPEAHETFFKPNDDYLSQSEVYQLMTPVFGKGLVYDATPKRRAQQMQFMAYGLRTSRMKTYVEKIARETELYFNSFPKEGVFSLKKIFSEVTILTASRALLGDEVRENLFKEVSALYCDLDGGTTPLSFFFPYLPIPMHRKRDQARAKMVELFSKVIKQRRDSGKRADDILDTFMNSSYKDSPNEPIPDDHVVGLLIALLFAGQHTSSLTLTWAVINLLLCKPELVQKLIDEQNEVLGDGGNENLNFDALNNMPLMHACIKESLRISPPLIFLMRKVMKDVMYKDMTIPAGHIVFSSPAVAGRLDDFWQNANSYDPERFLDDRNEEGARPYTNISFGGGMHGCMGQQYAYIQVKIVLSMFLRTFQVDLLDKKYPETDFTCLVVPPKSECLARMVKK